MAFCGVQANTRDEHKEAEVTCYPPVAKVMIVSIGARVSKDGKALDQLLFSYKMKAGQDITVHGKGKSAALKRTNLFPGERIIEATSFRAPKSGTLGLGAEFITSRGRTLLMAGDGVTKRKDVTSKKFEGWMMTGIKLDKNGFKAMFMDKPKRGTFRRKMEALHKEHGGKVTYFKKPSKAVSRKAGKVNFCERRTSALHEFKGIISNSTWKTDGEKSAKADRRS